MNKIEVINDWEPETRDLLDALLASGFSIVKGHNGEEEFVFNGDITDFIDNLQACDESHLYIYDRELKHSRWLFLVFGNSPGELVSDYSIPKGVQDSTDKLNQITKDHYDKWELKGQPKKRGYYESGKFIKADTLPV